MAHDEQREFCLRVRALFPQYFVRTRVLDIGSLDVNGNNRYLFEACDYLGVDVVSGPNVDVVGVAHEICLPEASVDVVVSTECLEHDPFLRKTLLNAVRILRPQGLLLLTCAASGRPEHGTPRTDGGVSSPLTARIPGWATYYANLSEADFHRALPLVQVFERYCFELNNFSHDLYFWGIRGSEPAIET